MPHLAVSAGVQVYRFRIGVVFKVPSDVSKFWKWFPTINTPSV